MWEMVKVKVGWVRTDIFNTTAAPSSGKWDKLLCSHKKQNKKKLENDIKMVQNENNDY